MSVLGIFLLAAAGILLLAELAAPGIGVAGVTSAVALVLGVAVLAGDAPGPTLSPGVAAPVVAVAAAATAVAARAVVRSHREPPLTTGPGAVLGREATVRRPPGSAVPQGFVAGAWWTLRSSGAPLADGDRVCVVDVDGLDLIVDLVAPAVPPSSEPEQKDQ
jgi:membrane-bound ClpP family serine protease